MAIHPKHNLPAQLLPNGQRVIGYVLAVLWLIALSSLCCGQPPAGGQEGLFNKQGQIKPDQRFWTVKDGKLILSMTAQELQELERKARESTEIPIALSSAELSVAAGDSSALVKAKLSITTDGSSNAVRRFDLQLKNCHLIEDPVFKAESGVADRDQLITTDEGYRWHHLSQVAGKHSVSLVAKCLVSQNSDRRSLNLDLPSVGTILDIDLPVGSIEERVRAEDLIESRTADEKGVHLKIRTRGGSFTLSWRPATAQAQVTAVEAKCNTLYEPADLLDPSQFWSATTTMTVRWFGSQANAKIQLVLPDGAQWNQLPYSEPDRFRITTMMPQSSATDSDPSMEVLEIENLDTAEYPSIENLKLQWRWLPKDAKTDRVSAAITLPVPRIIGADSYDGNVEVVFPNAFQATYQEGNAARFVQQGRIANLVGRQQIQFQYKGSDASMNLNFRKEQFQPVVQPIYHVHVRENRLELTGWIKSSFDNSFAELGILPGNWRIEDDLACVLSDPSAPNSNDTEPLLVQKLEDGNYLFRPRETNADDEDRQVEQLWRFVAWQPIEVGKTELQFQLPQIDRGRSIGQKLIDHGSGVLLITSENYLLLQSDDTKLQGLMRGSFAGEYSSYLSGQIRQPLAYRFQRQSATPNWLGQISVLARHIDVNQMVDIEVQSNRTLVRQDFDLKISNRALNDLQLQIRDDAIPIRVTVAGLTLTLSPVGATQTASATSEPGWKSYRLEGLPELLGNSQLSLLSSTSFKAPSPRGNAENEEAKSQFLEVPLAQLIHPDAKPNGPIRWKASSSLPLDLKFGSLSLLPANGSTNPSVLEIDSQQKTIELGIQDRAQPTNVGVVNKGTWVQTLLNGVERRDRLVARVSSNNRQINIQLPEQAQLDFRVAIDGKQLSAESATYDYSLHRAQIQLPDENEHTIEVFYTLTESLSWITPLEISPAKVADATSHERFYWQLVTPSIFHLGWCPDLLTAEWQWKWDIVCWNRVSEFDQQSLEQQLGAATLTRLPLGTNSYVMSGYDDFPTVKIWVLSRFILWLPVGLVSILITVLTLNVAALRNPTSLILLCLSILVLAVIWPDLSLLIGQTAVVSIGLVGLIWTTQAAVQTKVRRRSVFSTRPVTSTDVSDHQHTATRSARSHGSAERPASATAE